MTPELAVVCDQLRTLGLEDVARWVEHPEAVRELLRHSPVDAESTEPNMPECPQCESGPRGPHGRHCEVAAAWRTLGDPRGAADIERAHEEALRQDDARRPIGLLTRTPGGVTVEWIPVEARE